MALILLVDDDEDIRAAFGHALRCRGHHVAEAGDGSEALRILDDGLRPSLILLDSDMPILDGSGFREAQLLDPDHARIPVILITGEECIEELAGIMRPIGIVKKPVGFNAFLSTVELVLQRIANTSRPLAHA